MLLLGLVYTGQLHTGGTDSCLFLLEVSCVCVGPFLQVGILFPFFLSSFLRGPINWRCANYILVQFSLGCS